MVQHFLISANGISCALPLSEILTVIPMMETGPSPDARKGIAGTINFHGRIIPVFSLKSPSQPDDRQPQLSDMLVLARAGDETVALWIEETRGIAEIDISLSKTAVPGDEPTPPPGTRVSENGILAIVDLPLFLSRGLDVLPPVTRKGGSACGDPPITPGDETDPITTREVLAERARKMLPPQAESSYAEITELLRFQLAYQEYAVEMNYVREVILTGEITPVPGTPDFIAGICAARGQIISLVDLRALFRIPLRGLTDLNRVIVMTNGEITFGILADTISGIGTVALDQILPPGPGDLPEGRRYVKGVLGSTTILLDAAAILGDPGMIVDDA